MNEIPTTLGGFAVESLIGETDYSCPKPSKGGGDIAILNEYNTQMVGRATELCNRVEALGDRMYGTAPASDEAVHQSHPVRNGQFGHAMDIADLLGSTLSRLTVAIERIEGI